MPLVDALYKHVDNIMEDLTTDWQLSVAFQTSSGMAQGINYKPSTSPF